MEDIPPRAAANVTAALAMLLDEMSAALRTVNEAGAAAFARGDYPAVERLRAAAVEQQRLAEAVRSLREGWVAAHPAPPALQAPPQSVTPPAPPSVQREPPAPYVAPAPQRRAGSRTREQAYFLPILRALAAHGGRAHASDVLECVWAEVKDSLTQIDLGQIPSGEPRWRNTAQWARKKMVQQGLLQLSSPAGIWEISPAGREYLAQHGG